MKSGLVLMELLFLTVIFVHLGGTIIILILLVFLVLLVLISFLKGQLRIFSVFLVHKELIMICKDKLSVKSVLVIEIVLLDHPLTTYKILKLPLIQETLLLIKTIQILKIYCTRFFLY